MYYCQMPGCNYICEDKSQIHEHHIIPRELGGSNKLSNLIDLCPNCHMKVFIPEATSGNHSIKHNNSVVLLSKLLSTEGIVIAYRHATSDDIEYSLIKKFEEGEYGRHR